MVLSNAIARVRYTSSYTNLPQGGGPNKAGLPGSACRPYSFWICKVVHQTSDTLYGIPGGLRYTVNPNVRQSRPMGSTLTPNPYWNMHSVYA